MGWPSREGHPFAITRFTLVFEMIFKTLIFWVVAVALMGVTTPLVITSQCRPPVRVLEGQTRLTTSATQLIDEPQEHHLRKLLALAFRSAAAMPIDPHIKTRSRLQESVALACLELKQPVLALEYLEDIGNWRRGSALADLATYCLERELGIDIEPYLERALRIADENAKDPTSQAWRRDRIRSKVASVRWKLGQRERALELQKGTVDSESGRVDALRAATLQDFDLDKESLVLDRTIETGSFDQALAALRVWTQIFDRYVKDPLERDRAEHRVKTAYSRLPVNIRFDLLQTITESAIDHGEFAKALQLAEDLRGLIDGVKWLPEDHVVLLARVAELRFRAGDKTRARADAGEARSLFEHHRTRIVDIFRSRPLVALAEALHAMGSQAALSVFGEAVKEALANPNSRPRAEDLVNVCLSLATHWVEPDAALWAQLERGSKGLGHPW